MGEEYEAMIVLLLMIVIAFLIPAKFDPAIRLKEFNEAWRKRMEGK